MFKPTTFSGFFAWRNLLLAGVLSLGVMTGELHAQQNKTYGTVPIGKADNLLNAFQENSNARQGSPASKVFRHTTSDGSKLALKLNKADKKGGRTRYMGYVNDSKSETFDLNYENGKLTGHVVLLDKKKAYQYSTDASGITYVTETDINKLVCIDYKAANGNTNGNTAAPAAASPVISPVSYTYQSLPAATGGTVFLDFDGQNFASSSWFGGGGYAIPRSHYSDADIRLVYEYVANDFAPFSVNVTTDSAAFAATPAGKRVRVMFAPAKWVSPGAAGVARIGSYSWTTNEEPCWVFSDVFNMARDAAEAASHEAGHTLDLVHDGTSTASYYSGQGNWGPIMGTAYGRDYSQWSKGEFYDAYNFEDDIAIIASHTGLKADDHGNTNTTATTITANNGRYTQSGLIGTAADVDVFKFVVAQAGTLDFNVSVKPFATNLKLKADLYNNAGTLVASYVSVNGKGVSNTFTSFAAGTYYLHIDGVGQDNPLTDGFSDYNSQGFYDITASLITTAGGCTLTAWSASATYTNGSVVSYNGNKYTAKWWTENNRPDLNTGDGKPWTLNGPCSSNQNPQVSLVSPQVNQVIVPYGDLAIQATASDGDGFIAYVEIYVDNVFREKVTTAPYTHVLKNITPGTYQVKAIAYDNNGAAVTSSVVSFRSNNAPSVNFLNPAYNDVLIYGSNIQLAIAPVDTDGQIVKAEFYYDGDKVGEKITAPWTVPVGPVTYAKDTETGELPVRVVITDNDGQVLDETMITKVRVSGQNQNPTISLSGNSVVLPDASTTISANAIDKDGFVNKVEYYLDGSKVAEFTIAPYEYTTPSLPSGSYTLNVIATDDLGATATATLVIKSSQRPTVSFTSPAPMTLFQIGSNINASVNASDSDGTIQRVEFYFQAVPAGTKYEAPWTVNMGPVPAPFSAGTDSIVVLVAVAFDNDGAAMGTTVPVRVTKKPVITNSAPTVTITAPVANSKYVIGGSVTVSANVTDIDNDAITKVEIYSPQLGSGSTVTITSPPYTTTYSQLPIASQQVGGLVFVVKAFDAKGAVGAADVFVYLDQIPTVNITSPSANSVLNPGAVTITADAYDPEGLTRVDFLNAIGAVIASDNTAPYQYTTPSLASGAYTYRAIAYDNAGQHSTTASVSFTVNQLPTVSITSPANGTTVLENSNLTITASAADADGSISKVEFYSNTGGKLGEDNTVPYQLTITAVRGNHVFYVKAIDNLGGETTSTFLAVTVNAAPSTCTDPVWSASSTYTTNMIVSYNGKRYKANYWSQGANPETHSAAYQEWALLGNCGARFGLENSLQSLSVAPNPLEENSTVAFGLESADYVSVVLYNTLGEKAATVFEGQLEAGLHNYILPTQDLASGVYIVRLESASLIQQVKVIRK